MKITIKIKYVAAVENKKEKREEFLVYNRTHLNSIQYNTITHGCIASGDKKIIRLARTVHTHRDVLTYIQKEYTV